jgi:peptide/nickel transport system permease protein
MISKRFVIKRLLLLIPVLFGVATFVFAILQLSPGDPARVVAGQRATEAFVRQVRHEMGLDRPIWVQYGQFLWDAVHLNLGQSYQIRKGVPVTNILLHRLPVTVEMALYGQLFGILFGIPLGVISAIKQDSATDHLTRIGALTGISIPIYWSTLLNGNFAAFKSAAMHLILPSLVIGIYSMALISRMMRSSMLEVVRQDYIRTARAKGQGTKITMLKHGFRNALIPVVTVIGIQFGTLLGGAVLTESVFGIPGIGTMLVSAIEVGDFPVVQGTVLTFALLFTLVNLFVDITYSYLDPRIQQ